MLTHVHSNARSMALTTEEKTVETVIHHARTRLIVELDDVDDIFLDETSIESFIDFLNKERLTSMPHRGSRWDRALRSAEYFALQISSYADLIERFTPGSLDGVNVGLASCCLLLQLGKEQDKALEPSFAVLYRIGLSLRFLIKHGGFFVDHAIQNEVQKAFSTLLQLVSEMALLYRAKTSTISRRVTVDFYGTFGKTIHHFHEHKDRIADLMWRFALQSEQFNTSVDVIRQFLEPRDSILKLLASDQFAARTKRTEFTCEWFQPHLADFLRSSDQTLAITGPSGSGKTVLAGWIEERLQRPLARKSYETIEYRFESDLPTEATSLACVKNLLLQLLQQNVGDAHLFSKLASAHTAFVTSGDVSQLENTLWDALHVALDVYKDGSTKLIIVIDGLEQLSGEESMVSAFATRIQRLVNKHVCVRTIILAQSNYVANAKHTKEIHLSLSLVNDDIRRVAQDILQRNRHFQELGVDLKRGVCDQIVKKSNGSFLYAELLARSMLSEDDQKAFSGIVSEAPKGVPEFINRSMPREQLSQTDIKKILAWTLAAQRPLTISELSDLLRADLQGQCITDKRPDARAIIRKRLNLILIVDSHSIIRFRHGEVRRYVLDISSKGNLFPWQEAQNDLLLRLLLYTKVCVHDEEPSFDMLTVGEINDTYRRHGLLEYAITYWLDHFRQTLMLRGESLELSPEFKAVFPSSARMVLFEWSRWTESLTVRGALGLHVLCHRLRREVFGEKHSVVVQSLVVLSSIRYSCNEAHEAIKLMFQATQIAQAAFAQYHAVALKCSLVLLTFTDSVSDITRTEIMQLKEQTLKYVIAAYKYHEEIELVIQYTKALFQLYVQTQEDDLATRVYKELYEIVIKCYGRHSEELVETERLMIVLERSTKPQEIGPWTGEIICGLPPGKFDAMDITQIEVTIRTAEAYETEGKLFLAEEVMVTLWARIVELSRVDTSVEIQVAKIDCALAYVKFLRRLKKHEEASAILICIWAEYEHKMDSLDAEAIIIRIKVVGELMKSFGLFSIAISVFSKVWSYFKRSDKTTHEVARSTTVLISESIEEVTTQQQIRETKAESTTTTTTTMASTTTEESKITIREMFESRMSSCKSTTEHKSVLKSCSALIAVYRQERQWQEAITTIQTSLELVWKAVIIDIGMISLPETCSIEAIHIAIQLAECYVEERRLEEAEKIYVRIYQACRFSLSVEHKQLSFAVERLISFYESIHRHEKTIEVYSDIIDCYRRQLGVQHSLTIKTMYAFSRMLREYGYNRCYEYYSEIVTALNQGSDVCHYDALEAAVVLLKFYKSEKRWTDLRRMCEVLWSAFVRNQKEYKLALETIKLIYATYSLVLEKHIKAEFTIQRKVAMEYRETSLKYFGTSASITVEASMAFASVCERHEKYQHEAISVYEEVIKKTSQTTSTVATTSTTTSIFQSVKKRLTKLYVSTISSAQTTTSTTTMERAITLSTEMCRETKVQFGCWHEKTISHFHGVLVIYKKMGTKEAHEKIIKLLREIVIEVLSVEKSPWRLYNASIAIAKLFVELQIIDRGIELLNDLHSHVVAQENSLPGMSSIKLSQHHGKATYIFLVGFELILHKTVDISYSEIMVNLITENMLFEQFKRVTEAKVKVEVVLLHGARLRQFLRLHGRHHQCGSVEKQIFKVFIRSYGSLLKTKEEASFAFFITLLEHIGKINQEVLITNAACESGVERVRVLLESGEYQHAYDMAYCVYQFTSGGGAYRDIKNVTLGINLCQYLVGKWITELRDEKLRQHMLDLSKIEIQHILDACRDAGVNFVQLPLDILEGLVALLGSQHHYDYLEWLLKKLWSSREAQKLWPQEVIIGAGRSLVNAKFAHGHHDAHDQKGDHGHRNSAIDLCEDICYNLRRARGSTDPTTLVFYKLLAALFTSTHRLEDAIRAHTDVLKFIVEGEDNDDYDPDDADDAVLRPIAVTHVRLLKTTCQRLKGWGGRETEIDRLVGAVARRFGDNTLSNTDRPTKWDLKKKPAADDSDGLWHEPAVWTIRMDMEGSNKRYQPRRQITRAISNYGLGGVRKSSGNSTSTRTSGRVPTLASFAKEGVNGKVNGHAGVNGNGVINGVR